MPKDCQEILVCPLYGLLKTHRHDVDWKTWFNGTEKDDESRVDISAIGFSHPLVAVSRESGPLYFQALKTNIAQQRSKQVLLFDFCSSV